jgi:hypothetical protein
VLRGACDDLIAPRSFGPLQDRVAGHVRAAGGGGRGGADRDAVFEAAFAELSGSGGPRCWSSRTCTGPTTPRWTSCACSGAASPTCPPSSC